jgi:hypothetical protein
MPAALSMRLVAVEVPKTAPSAAAKESPCS